MSTSDVDVQQLITRARRGDNGALGKVLELFRAYLGLLTRLRLERQIQLKVNPSDVVQETFLEAKKGFARFRGSSEQQLMAWLRRILAAQIARQVRFHQRRRRSVHLEQQLCEEIDHSSAGLLRGLVDPGTTPSARAAQREAEVLVADALAQLSEEHREVIILHSFQGLSFPEVAQRMGRSRAAVKSLWVRALGNLRRIIGKLRGESPGQQKE